MQKSQGALLVKIFPVITLPLKAHEREVLTEKLWWK